MQANRSIRLAVAYVVAGAAGYLLASTLFTAVNVIRLSEVGAQISFSDAARTAWFDVRGMAPSFQWTQYGTLISIGLAIAFPVAAASHSTAVECFQSGMAILSLPRWAKSICVA